LPCILRQTIGGKECDFAVGFLGRVEEPRNPLHDPFAARVILKPAFGHRCQIMALRPVNRPALIGLVDCGPFIFGDIG